MNNRLKDLKTGDSCVIAKMPFVRGLELVVKHTLVEGVVTKVGRVYVYVRTEGRTEVTQYHISDRAEHFPGDAPRAWLYESLEEYAEYTADIAIRKDLARRLHTVSSLHCHGLDTALTTEAAQRMVAIYEDPTSRVRK